MPLSAFAPTPVAYALKPWAISYLTGSVSNIFSRTVILGYHRDNAGSPSLSQSQYDRLVELVQGREYLT
jgi:hypothetical protein